MDTDDKLRSHGAGDRAKGKVNKGLGNVEENVGQATGDEEMEDRGLERQGKGQVQKGVGKAKEVLGDALKD